MVARGYDEVAERYLKWHNRPDPTTEWFLRTADSRIPRGTRVLDLGCGAGVPVTRPMLAGCRVIGLDLSRAQLALASKLVPKALLVRGDLADVTFVPSSFDAVVAFYAFMHIPRAEQPRVIRRVGDCLRPGGTIAANFGTGSDDPVKEDWLGTAMFFASFDAATNEQMVRDAGLEIELSEVRAIEEDGEAVDFHWLIASKPWKTVSGERG